MILIYLQSDIPCFQPTDEQVRRFDALLPECADRPVRACRTEAEFVSLLPEATAVFVWTFRQDWFALAPRLRHLCTPAAGRDYFKVTPPPEVTMHYGSFHGAIMGETALGCLLAWCHGLLPFAGTMKADGGSPWPRLEMARHGRRLAGSSVTILGYGHIGRIFARMLVPFGAKVTGVTRTPHPELADEAAALGVALATADRLDALLPATDHLVCFLPSGAATTNLLDARRLALLRRGAALYNFGRGNLIDEAALAEALARGRLGAAVLDVFKVEPLPADSPLRRAPNCWLYPHASAFAPDYLDLYFAKCAEAIRKAGERK
jgi:phosphoglycerate dehydrogenase-like enzyme